MARFHLERRHVPTKTDYQAETPLTWFERRVRRMFLN